MNKGEQTRIRIIEAAMAVLNRNGGDMSISELMRDTELEKGGIYRHFASKDEIIAEAVAHYVSLIEEKLKHALAGRERARERLGALTESLLSIAHAPLVPGGCLVMNMAVASQAGGSKARALVRRTFKRWERLYVSEIERGTRTREFRKGIDVRGFAALAISSIEGAIVLAGAHPGMDAHEKVGLHLETLLDDFLT